MKVTTAFRDGIRRVNGAPMVLVGMFSVTLLIALPLSYALRGMIATHFGPSLAADSAAAGANYDWWQEFSAQATGLGTTFVPSIVGFGAVLDNLSGLLDNLPVASTIAGVTAAWLVVWSFLSGGVIDRLARARRTRSLGFFGACGMHFWRLLRLGACGWLFYWILFTYLHGWIFTAWLPRLTRDVTAERTAFAVRLLGYAIFGVLVVVVNVVFDYARVRLVVEDRRGGIGALAAGIRFVARHAASVLGLYAVNAVAFLVLVTIYAVVATRAPGAGLSMWLTLAVAEGYILARHYLKLLFYASETAFFQGALAHAGYTAAPAVVWPDSPAAETIVNADPAALPERWR
ncbi:MAG: hypothetical protein ABI818_01490 [Acidobacteriota bacterium]